MTLTTQKRRVTLHRIQTTKAQFRDGVDHKPITEQISQKSAT
jgi:hypothetical protein